MKSLACLLTCILLCSCGSSQKFTYGINTPIQQIIRVKVGKPFVMWIEKDDVKHEILYLARDATSVLVGYRESIFVKSEWETYKQGIWHPIPEKSIDQRFPINPNVTQIIFQGHEIHINNFLTDEAVVYVTK